MGKKVIELPKKKVIERFVQKTDPCTPAMAAVLDCFHRYQFSEERCAAQMQLLNDCVKGKESAPGKQRKSSLMYHLIRLYCMRR